MEFDGPTHYYNNIDDENLPSSLLRRDISRWRNAKTELRDLLLAKRCAKVVAVPWFEFEEVESSPENRRLYVRQKLLDAGVGL